VSNKGRRYHSWRAWLAGGGAFVERCSRCRLKRRTLLLSPFIGRPKALPSVIQQYRWPGGKWVRGHDGSILFDHGGVPPCVGPR